MKLILKILIFIAIVTAAIFLLPVIKEWNFQFDAHGKYISTDGSVHWESTTEKNFFYFLLSLLMLCVSSVVYSMKEKDLKY